jgi:excisionase family DNA binding protein
MSKTQSEIQYLVSDLKELYDAAPEDGKRAIQRTLDFLNRSTRVVIGDKSMIIIPEEEKMVIVEKIQQPSEAEENSPYVSTSEVAEYYGVTTETVRDWIRKKIIPAKRVGANGRYKILREDFELLKSKRDKSTYSSNEMIKEVLGDDFAEDWELVLDEEGV